MNYDEILKGQFNNINSDGKLDEFTKQTSNLTEGLSDEFVPEKLLDSILNGQSIFYDSQIVSSLKELFLLEIKSAMVICIEILFISIVIGIIKGLSDSFKTKSVADISMLICTMVIIGLSINSLKTSYNLALESTTIMVNTMEILIPVLIGILISTGAITSGTVLSPFILGTIGGMALIIKKFILPALFLSCILSLINSLTEKDYVNKLAKLIRNVSLSVTGFLLVIFSGIITVQGLLTETADSLLLDTAKFSLSNFIPIVGGFTSDTVELFLKCMSSIKNVIGIFGIITLLLLLLIPVVKILSIGIIYKITAALCEPISDSKVSSGLNDMGTSIIYICAIMFFTCLLFIIFITSILSIGGT